MFLFFCASHQEIVIASLNKVWFPLKVEKEKMAFKDSILTVAHEHYRHFDSRYLITH